MSQPIPENMLDQFRGYMSHAYHSDLPDGGWWAMLLEDAAAFLRENNLPDEANAAVHQLLRSHVK